MSSSGNIRFFISASSQLRCPIWTGAAARLSGWRDHESEHAAFEKALLRAFRELEGDVRRLFHLSFLAAVVIIGAGCAASQAFRNGNAAMKTGDLDQAVAYFR